VPSEKISGEFSVLLRMYPKLLSPEALQYLSSKCTTNRLAAGLCSNPREEVGKIEEEGKVEPDFDFRFGEIKTTAARGVFRANKVV